MQVDREILDGQATVSGGRGSALRTASSFLAVISLATMRSCRPFWRDFDARASAPEAATATPDITTGAHRVPDPRWTGSVELPDRLGRTVLWATAQAVYGIRENPGEDPVQFIAGGWL
ncbi:hypothetical protein ACFV23_03660 [Streptomyces sp. NPDC059627]